MNAPKLTAGPSVSERVAGTVPPTVPSSSTLVTWVRMTFEVVIGAIEASPVYSRIESTVTVTVTSPDAQRR